MEELRIIIIDIINIDQYLHVHMVEETHIIVHNLVVHILVVHILVVHILVVHILVVHILVVHILVIHILVVHSLNVTHGMSEIHVLITLNVY